MANRVIYIKRMWQTENSTISTFEVSGSNIKGYFLERPGRIRLFPIKIKEFLRVLTK